MDGMMNQQNWQLLWIERSRDLPMFLYPLDAYLPSASLLQQPCLGEHLLHQIGYPSAQAYLVSSTGWIWDSRGFEEASVLSTSSVFASSWDNIIWQRWNWIYYGVPNEARLNALDFTSIWKRGRRSEIENIVVIIIRSGYSVWHAFRKYKSLKHCHL